VPLYKQWSVTMVKFVERNLKPIFPFSWNVANSGGLLVGVVGDIPALPDAPDSS